MWPFGGKKESKAKQVDTKPLMILDDRKNSVELWPNKITIRRHGIMNSINVGLTGEKDIYLNNITGIQVKKPGMTTGYIQFMTMGSQDNKSGVTGAVKDENTVIFGGKKNYQRAQEIKQKIEELTRHSLSTAPPPSSTADELAKIGELWRQGILTDKEFEEQKKALLSGKS